MEIVLIILLALSLVCNYCLLYKKEKEIMKPKKQEKPKLNKEEEEKQKQIKKAFDNLMNYDEKTARQIRK